MNSVYLPMDIRHGHGDSIIAMDYIYFLPLRLPLLDFIIVSLPLLASHRPASLRRCRLASRPS